MQPDERKWCWDTGRIDSWTWKCYQPFQQHLQIAGGVTFVKTICTNSECHVTIPSNIPIRISPKVIVRIFVTFSSAVVGSICLPLVIRSASLEREAFCLLPPSSWAPNPPPSLPPLPPVPRRESEALWTNLHCETAWKAQCLKWRLLWRGRCL